MASASEPNLETGEEWKSLVEEKFDLTVRNDARHPSGNSGTEDTPNGSSITSLTYQRIKLSMT